MPTTPSEMACWTAVAITVGLVWSSITIPWIGWPLTPPAAFSAAILASKPLAASPNCCAAEPVIDEIRAILIGVLLPPDPLVVVVDELDDDPHADAMTANASVATTMDLFASEDFICPPPPRCRRAFARLR